MKYVILSVLLAGAACTTIPTRFTVDERIYPNCGYVTESMGDTGFGLEILFKEYNWGPSPDDAIRKGRECYTKTAAALAQGRGKKIAPITVADMQTSTSRNMFDINFSVYVTGKISYLSTK